MEGLSDDMRRKWWMFIEKSRSRFRTCPFSLHHPSPCFLNFACPFLSCPFLIIIIIYEERTGQRLQCSTKMHGHLEERGGWEGKIKKTWWRVVEREGRMQDGDRRMKWGQQRMAGTPGNSVWRPYVPRGMKWIGEGEGEGEGNRTIQVPHNTHLLKTSQSPWSTYLCHQVNT